MSSTGRGSRGGEGRDYFATPPWVVRRLAEHWTAPPGVLVEPSAGNGSIIRAWPEPRTWIAVEREPSCHEALMQSGATIVVTADFESVPEFSDAAAFVSNPPFSLAEEHLAHMRRAHIPCAVLERLPWLGDSLDRRELARRDPPALIVDVGRVDFEGDEEKLARRRRVAAERGVHLSRVPSSSGDSVPYAWFVWPAEPHEHLATRYVLSRPATRSERKERGLCGDLTVSSAPEPLLLFPLDLRDDEPELPHLDDDCDAASRT